MFSNIKLLGLGNKYESPFIFRHLLQLYSGCVLALTLVALVMLSLGRVGSADGPMAFNLVNIALLLGQGAVLIGLGWLVVRHSKSNYVAVVEWDECELALHTMDGQIKRFPWCEVLSHDLPTIEVSARTRKSVQIRIFSGGQQSYFHIPCSWRGDCECFLDVLKKNCEIK